MSNYSTSLTDLFGCFRGTVPKNANWMKLLGLANQTLTTTALIDIGRKESVPEDARRYIQELFERNLIRNKRLVAQLADAIAAMNDRGVIPILLKGAATLATAPIFEAGKKIMSDLDLVVEPDEVDKALAGFFALGYNVDYRTQTDAKKQYTDLKRESDVGMIDLHNAPPGPEFFYSASGGPKQHCKLISVDGGSAYVPHVTYHALILIVHDQFQDYDYWTGKIDVRHLLDLRDLVNSPEGIDWDLLISFVPNKLARHALETQLITLSTLLDVAVPAHLLTRVIPRLQFRRRLLQAKHPSLRTPLMSLGLLDYHNHRTGVGGTNAPDRRPLILPKWQTLHFLLKCSRERPVGKV